MAESELYCCGGGGIHYKYQLWSRHTAMASGKGARTKEVGRPWNSQGGASNHQFFGPSFELFFYFPAGGV